MRAWRTTREQEGEREMRRGHRRTCRCRGCRVAGGNTADKSDTVINRGALASLAPLAAGADALHAEVSPARPGARVVRDPVGERVVTNDKISTASKIARRNDVVPDAPGSFSIHGVARVHANVVTVSVEPRAWGGGRLVHAEHAGTVLVIFGDRGGVHREASVPTCKIGAVRGPSVIRPLEVVSFGAVSKPDPGAPHPGLDHGGVDRPGVPDGVRASEVAPNRLAPPASLVPGLPPRDDAELAVDM